MQGQPLTSWRPPLGSHCCAGVHRGVPTAAHAGALLLARGERRRKRSGVLLVASTPAGPALSTGEEDACSAAPRASPLEAAGAKLKSPGPGLADGGLAAEAMSCAGGAAQVGGVTGLGAASAGTVWQRWFNSISSKHASVRTQVSQQAQGPCTHLLPERRRERRRRLWAASCRAGRGTNIAPATSRRPQRRL